MKVKIKNPEIQEIIKGEVIEFPKYSTQLMNLANANSGGTRPKIVGQMSDLIQEFEGNSIDQWESWYKEKNPLAIDKAVDKIYPMIKNLRDSIDQIDKELVREWVKDLVVTKTFLGLKFQEAILKKIADIKKTTYKLANPLDEAKGIDGYINDMPISIKPITYKLKSGLGETIDVYIVYYDKKKDGISIEFNF